MQVGPNCGGGGSMLAAETEAHRLCCIVVTARRLLLLFFLSVLLLLMVVMVVSEGRMVDRLTLSFGFQARKLPCGTLRTTGSQSLQTLALGALLGLT
jgi:hypothetical protein